MGIRGQKFVITGAAEGMGVATARMAASRGAKVCLADIDVEKGEAAAKSIRDAGGFARFVACDVTDDAALSGLMREAAGQMGGIDVLHNNAGVIDLIVGDRNSITVENLDRKVWDKVLAINLSAPMFAAKAALPFLKKSSNASIINAASTAAFVGGPTMLAYGASKAGLATLTKNLAVDLAPFGIRANCYCPGVIDTSLTDRYRKSVPDPAAIERLFYKSNLMPRIGRAEEIADLVCYLAGDESRYVNGAVWIIDGGQLAWRGTLDMLGM
jgi:NAD(P)-dependent dehydrogenase (short-subunit alcohol dehydrogenase family)